MAFERRRSRAKSLQQDPLAALDGQEFKGRLECLSCRVFNEDNGWGFGDFYLPEGMLEGIGAQRVKITGTVAQAYPGGYFEVTGVWQDHPTYGSQIKATTVLPELVNARRPTIAWLEHHLPDIGPKRARSLVDTHGDALYELLERGDVETLCKAPMIGEVIAQQAIRAYMVTRLQREQWERLASYGLDPRAIQTAVSAWGASAAEKVEADPYVLLELPRMHWKRVDVIARSGPEGIRSTDPRRIVAGIRYAAVISQWDGHTCRTQARLLAIACGDVLRLDLKTVSAQWGEASKGLVEYQQRWFRPQMHAYQQTIVRHVGAAIALSRGEEA